MRVGDYNKKFNLENKNPEKEDLEDDERDYESDYNEDERDDDEGDSPPSISSLGVYVPFICS